MLLTYVASQHGDTERLENLLESGERKEVPDEFLDTLENNMKNFFQYPSELPPVFERIRGDPEFSWLLFKSLADAPLNCYTLQRHLTNILKLESQKSNRVFALKLQIKVILSKQYGYFAKYHENVLANMETSIQNKFPAELIFDFYTLGQHVQEAVQATRNQVIDELLNNI